MCNERRRTAAALARLDRRGDAPETWRPTTVNRGRGIAIVSGRLAAARVGGGRGAVGFSGPLRLERAREKPPLRRGRENSSLADNTKSFYR